MVDVGKELLSASPPHVVEHQHCSVDHHKEEQNAC